MSSTFVENWFKVAPLQLGLLPTVEVHKQRYRNHIWYVLHDRGGDKYFRVTPQAYSFLLRLRPDQTVDEIWMQAVEEAPEEVPSQQEVMQLLAQLHHNNLLFFRSEADSEAIFARFAKGREREFLSHLMAFIYFKIPVWNPDAFLDRWRHVLGPIFGWVGFAVWLFPALFALGLLLDDWGRVSAQAAGLISWENLPLLYAAIFIMKLFHEMAHAIVCKRYGGHVYTLGLMFIVFTPLPYVDASSSWSMRQQKHRIHVGVAGMYTEIFFASVACIAWYYVGPGILSGFLFNVMVAGSISAVIFNGNPLLRFDAYFMLSDALNLPNLYQKSSQQWLYWADRYALGTVGATPPSDHPNEQKIFALYGVLSFAYRMVVMVFITQVLADLWLGFGAMMIGMLLMVWVVMPLFKLLRHLLRNPLTRPNQMRAISVCLGIFISLVGGLGFIPIPDALEAPGVVQAVSKQTLYTIARGRIENVHVRHGDWVSQGDILVEMSNTDLDQNIARIDYQLEEFNWRLRAARRSRDIDPGPILQQTQALVERKADLLRQQNSLIVRAPQSGIFSAPSLGSRVGSFIARGEELATIIDEREFRLSTVVTQDDVSTLFDGRDLDVEVRLHAKPGIVFYPENVSLIPFQRFILPSPAMSIPGGGDIAVQRDAEGVERAIEPFFELQAPLKKLEGVRLQEGLLATARIALEPKPLISRWVRDISQTLQRRYQL